MPVVRTKKQQEMYKKYKSLQKEFKRKGVPMGMFDYVFQKVAVSMKPAEIEKLIRDNLKDMVDV